MAPERVGHARIKGKVFSALTAAVEAAGVPCEVLVDGPTIEVGESDYEPDVTVRCGSEVVSDDSLTVPDATTIVEVLSPTTRRIDVSQKLVDYFGVPSVRHYLILFADRVQAIHHRRDGERIETRVVTEGNVTLAPPGIVLSMASFVPSGGTWADLILAFEGAIQAGPREGGRGALTPDQSSGDDASVTLLDWQRLEPPGIRTTRPNPDCWGRRCEICWSGLPSC